MQMEIDIKEFRRIFNRRYSYIGYDMTDVQIKGYLTQDHVKNLDIDNQMDLFQDYLLSNDLCEVQD